MMPPYMPSTPSTPSTPSNSKKLTHHPVLSTKSPEGVEGVEDVDSMGVWGPDHLPKKLTLNAFQPFSTPSNPPSTGISKIWTVDGLLDAISTGPVSATAVGLRQLIVLARAKGAVIDFRADGFLYLIR